jgi:DNA-binding beta-propeller fold protein YncE
MRIVACLLTLLCFCVTAAEEVKFSAPPKAVKSGDKTTITFAVSAPTDVEVGILDGSGKVIRHLVAGVVGGKGNPPEPLKNGLSQSVEWDGKDDGGKPATGGGFKVRVAAGMKPQFENFLLYNRDGSGGVTAVACGPNGSLYAFYVDSCANGNMGGHKIKIYGRDGKHQKVLAPFPADISPDRVKALGVYQTTEGDIIPHIYNYETLSFYPDTIGVRGRDMPGLGSAPAVDSKGRVYWLVKGPVLCALDADGGVPYDKFLGPALLPEVKNLAMANEYLFGVDTPSLAVSSDDAYVYVSGLHTGELGKADSLKSIPCVYRVTAKTRTPAEVFVGKPDQPGAAKELLSAPRGIAVAKGMLYVADPGADRIVVFKEADRSFAGEIKVKNPQSIGVDPSSGAVYVCAYTGKQTADLIKLAGLGGDSELARIKLLQTGQSPNPGVHRIAVDATAKPVQIWVPGLPYSTCTLDCYEDTGSKFVAKGDIRGKETQAEGPRDLCVDRARDELYVKGNTQKYYRIDEKTGKLKDVIDLGQSTNWLNMGDKGTQLVAGFDGNLYTDSWSVGLWRFDHQGKSLNWPGQSSPTIPIGGHMCFQERHLALKPYVMPDEFYLVTPSNYLTKKESDGSKFVSINVLGLDGQTRRTVVWQCMMGATPRVDAKGNIYVADLVKPPDHSYPEFFDGKLPPPPKECGGGDLFWNSYMYASIIKFPPSGGIIWFDKNLPKSCVGSPSPELLAKPKVPFKRHFAFSPHLTGELQGAEWYRFGMAPYSTHMSGNTSHCMCEGSGFDVDGYGRVYYPNCGQSRVEMIDTNNNWIGTFGKYGNEDSGGKDAKIKKPEIPLAWPVYVAVSDTHVYVADTVNRRVVSVKLNYAAEATCSAP